jgi:hypothetical protein
MLENVVTFISDYQAEIKSGEHFRFRYQATM